MQPQRRAALLCALLALLYGAEVRCAATALRRRITLCGPRVGRLACASQSPPLTASALQALAMPRRALKQGASSTDGATVVAAPGAPAAAAQRCAPQGSLTRRPPQWWCPCPLSPTSPALRPRRPSARCR